MPVFFRFYLYLNNGNLCLYRGLPCPALLQFNNKRLKQIVKLFFVSGQLSELAIYWLVNVTLLGTIVLSLYLSLYFILFGLLLYYNIKSFKARLLIFAPSVWVLLEYARSHIFTGFPWALLGYSQYLNLPLVQIADIFGVWGISFLLIFSNVAIAELLQFKKKGLLLSLKITLAVITAVVLLVLSYGFYRLSSLKNIESLKKINISVIQPNISQRLKWDPAARNFIMQRYFELTDEAVLKEPELIIWPEAALPVVLEEEPAYYQSLKGYVGTIRKNLIFGAVTQRGGLYYNSALLLSKSGS